ncbi:MAG TPA: LapA family protein [Candidatus Paceibacterota bacterium]|nr:LapA family protein [Candidatus Paceibacterota bacterium]HMP18779.1 LapA family protein [Candidatus Paceibacterota bacterium]HMP85583.1 LapA family protein [Candidatus Paceibacterota bacterium]
MIISLILVFLILLSAGLVFNFQNLDLITVKFWIISFESPIGLIIVTSFIVGVLIPILIMMPPFLTRGYKIKKKNEEIAKMKKRLDDSAIMFESGGLGNEGETYKHN